MNRKPIFDAVRVLLNRGFRQDEVEALDQACDLAEAAVDPERRLRPQPASAPATMPLVTRDHVLGSLSERFESGGRGPGTVSSGTGDAGGVSYGTYQLSSKTGTCGVFMKSEGKRWADRFGNHKPGDQGFSAAWVALAKAEPDEFRNAQHAFIERTHYRVVVEAVSARKGLDLDSRHDAVRDAVWSCAVQHGKAANVLIDGIDIADRDVDRFDTRYDRALVEAIYKARIAFVLEVADDPKKPADVRAQLISITKNRYPEELRNALAMLDDAPTRPASQPAPPAATTSDGSIDGNAIAKANGVAVKSGSVRIGGLDPHMAAVIVAVAEAARKLGLPQPVITSGNDSRHKAGSLHFKNRALDFRGNNLKVSVGRSLANAVSAQLGGDYDVLFEMFENPANNHLHVEFDPK